MAYMNSEKKAKIAAALKVALKAYPTVKYSLSVQNHSSITCRIKQGPKSLDPEGKGYVSVNVYWIDSHYDGETAKILNTINGCLNLDNFNDSDSQSDYFSVGHYVHIEIGQWDKPYIVV